MTQFDPLTSGSLFSRSYGDVSGTCVKTCGKTLKEGFGAFLVLERKAGMVSVSESILAWCDALIAQPCSLGAQF